jgi:hypothetical protein
MDRVSNTRYQQSRKLRSGSHALRMQIWRFLRARSRTWGWSTRTGSSGFQSLLTMGLTSPVTSLTGKGRQLFYRHPGGKLSNAVRKFPGIDIRGDGGYVVAPPSIHPNGKRYQWLSPGNAL